MTTIAAGRHASHRTRSYSIDFTGAVQLLRLYLRRDRIVLPLWSIYLGIFPAIEVASVKSLYSTQAELDHLAESTAASPAQVAMYGPVFSSELGSISTWKAGAFYTIIAIAAILTVIRHTRVEEETGRAELVGATRIGRYAGLTATLTLAAVGSVVAGIVCAAGLLAVGLPATGSVAFGAALAASGLAWAGIAAIAAQVSAGARLARGIALAALAVTYVLRAVGDAGSGTLSWFSPVGWCLQIRPYAQERWWVLLPLLALAALTTTAAYSLLRHRDIGAGLLAERPGPSAAAATLAGPLGLAWRLQRGVVVSWTIGLGLYGLLIGSAAHGVGNQLGDSKFITDLLTRMGGSPSIEASFIAYAFAMLAIAASAFSISAVLRLHDEESKQRAEATLAGAVGRARFMLSHITFGLLGPAIALAAAGLAAGVVYGAAVHDMGKVLELLGAALVQLPAVWIMTGLTVVLFGVVPRFAPAAWGLFVGVISLFLIGSAGGLSHWVLDLVPFGHTPKLPGNAVTTTPIVWLLVVSAGLIGAGVLTFRRRDLR